MSKRITEVSKVRLSNPVTITEALEKLHQYSSGSFVAKSGEIKKLSANFIESVSLEVELGVDGKRSDQMIKSSLFLPCPHGRKTKLLIIAESISFDLPEFATFLSVSDLPSVASGAFKLKNYDTCLATESAMKSIASSGASKNIGIAGLMPSVKSGTVFKTDEALTSAMTPIANNFIEIKSDKFGYLKCIIGKADIGSDNLKKNASDVIERIKQLKPASFKGILIRNIRISTTMGFSCPVSLF